ncbi:MAG: hypothetical protein RhofKO_33090 [Rhodothermales bacterium]
MRDRFCAQCGQQAESPIKPFRQFAADLFRDYFSLDTRFFHTLHHLFTRPGHLTLAYLKGYRARYIPPLRLYLVSSFLLFFSLAVLDVDTSDIVNISNDDDIEDTLTTDSVAVALGEAVRTLSTSTIALDSTATLLREDAIPADSAADTLGSTITTLNEVAAALQSIADAWTSPVSNPNPSDSANALAAQDDDIQSILTDRLTTGVENAARDEASFTARLIERAPIMMFGLQPISAFLLLLLYRRQKRLYAEHFVFSLHVHAFTYLVTLVLLLVESSRIAALVGLQEEWSNLTSLIVLAISSIYLFIAQRRMYQQTWTKTMLKYTLFGLAYMVVWILAFLVVIILTLMLS